MPPTTPPSSSTSMYSFPPRRRTELVSAERRQGSQPARPPPPPVTILQHLKGRRPWRPRPMPPPTTALQAVACGCDEYRRAPVTAPSATAPTATTDPAGQRRRRRPAHSSADRCAPTRGPHSSDSPLLIAWRRVHEKKPNHPAAAATAAATASTCTSIQLHQPPGLGVVRHLCTSWTSVGAAPPTSFPGQAA